MKKIVIASILKPVNEVRMYERFSLSLAKTNKYDINIIGIATKNPFQPKEGIHTLCLKTTGRSPVNRLRRQFQVFNLWKKLKPDLIIITTPELLLWAWFYGVFNRTPLIYDIQENYHANITFQGIYRFPSKHLYKAILNTVEKMTFPSFKKFILAEKCYREELHLPRDQAIVLENKVRSRQFLRQPPEVFTLLFTGTISEYTGIYTAIQTYREMSRIEKNCRLKIAGIAYDQTVIATLQDLATMDDNVVLHGITSFVDHDEIVDLICTSSLGLVCHQVNEVSQDRIPSKLYEYSYFGLPFLVPSNSKWHATSEGLTAGIPTDFLSLSSPNQLKNILATVKKTSYPSNRNASWDTEEQKLQDLIFTIDSNT